MNMRMNRGQLTSQRMPIQNLCNALANQLGRPVVNHTGLDGNFDYKLEWTPDPSPSIPGDSGEGAAAADPGGPSLAAGPYAGGVPGRASGRTSTPISSGSVCAVTS